MHLRARELHGARDQEHRRYQKLQHPRSDIQR
jgi:hypothetical protein